MEPLTNKKAVTVLNALKSIISKDVVPRTFRGDKGGELNNRYVKLLLKKPNQSGKSTFIHRLLMEADGMFEENMEHILFCYKEWQPTYDIMEKSVPRLTPNKGMPSREFLETVRMRDEKHSIVVLDD